MDHRFVIRIQAEAASKPAVGAPCNGCGVCCLSEPCPVGMLLSGRRRGPCRALQWDAQDSRYRCGVMAAAAQGRLAGWKTRLAGRWIGAGQGCDCELEVEPAGRG